MPTASPGIYVERMTGPQDNSVRNANRVPRRHVWQKKSGMPRGALEKYCRLDFKPVTTKLSNNGNDQVNQRPGTSDSASALVDPNVIFNTPAPVSRNLTDRLKLQKRPPSVENTVDVAVKRSRQESHVKNLSFEVPRRNQSSSAANQEVRNTGLALNVLNWQVKTAARQPKNSASVNTSRNQIHILTSISGTEDSPSSNVTACSSSNGMSSMAVSKTKQKRKESEKTKGGVSLKPGVPVLSTSVSSCGTKTPTQYSTMRCETSECGGTMEPDGGRSDPAANDKSLEANPSRDTVHLPMTNPEPQQSATGKGIRGNKRKQLEIVPVGDHKSLENLLQDQKWGAVFASIDEWLKTHVFPKETVMGRIITDILLPKTKGRVKKPGGVIEATRFLTRFLKELPHHENWEDYLYKGFKLANDKLRDRDPPENLVTKLLTSVDRESKCEQEKLAFDLFQSLTELLDREFKCNKIREVRVRYPQIIWLMVWDEFSNQLISYNSNWDRLLTQIFKFSPDSIEAKTLTKWVDLLVLQYHDMRAGVGGDDDRELHFLVEKTYLHLKSVKQQSRLLFLKLFGVKEFASDLCKKLILDQIPMPPSSITNWDSVLNELSAHVPSYDTAELVVDVETLPKKYRCKHESLMKKKNAKGETILHLAAASQNSSRYSEVRMKDYALFKEMRYHKFGDINIRDNGGNTPLHDAAFNNNLDMLAAIWRNFVHPGEPVSPWQLDILAQDNEGHTALHNAIQQGHKEVILRLVAMSKLLNRSTHLFYKLRNKCGDTAWDTLTKKSKLSGDEQIHETVRDLVGNPPKLRLHYGRYTFSEEAAKIIESDRYLWKLALYWREVQNNRR